LNHPQRNSLSPWGEGWGEGVFRNRHAKHLDRLFINQISYCETNGIIYTSMRWGWSAPETALWLMAPATTEVAGVLHGTRFLAGFFVRRRPPGYLSASFARYRPPG